MSKPGIYKILNLANQRCYIGSTVNLSKRWREHRYKLRTNKHHNQALQNAWNKYGKEKFVFEVIETVDCKDALVGHEQLWIDRYWNTSYNICKCADRPTGYKHSAQAKKQMAKRMKGNQHALGHRHSEETRKRMSKSHTGMKRSKQACANNAAAKIGANNPSAKPVIRIDPNTSEIKSYSYMKEAEKDGFKANCIWFVCAGRTKTHKGYFWEYA